MTEEQKFRIQLEAHIDQDMAFLKQRMTENEEPPLENHKMFFGNRDLFTIPSGQLNR